MILAQKAGKVPIFLGSVKLQKLALTTFLNVFLSNFQMPPL
jgi:hypothetical protein